MASTHESPRQCRGRSLARAPLARPGGAALSAAAAPRFARSGAAERTRTRRGAEPSAALRSAKRPVYAARSPRGARRARAHAAATQPPPAAAGHALVVRLVRHRTPLARGTGKASRRATRRGSRGAHTRLRRVLSRARYARRTARRILAASKLRRAPAPSVARQRRVCERRVDKHDLVARGDAAAHATSAGSTPM
jgi:hypothetical protein